MRSQFHLGASLYVPTSRDHENLVAIGDGEKIPELRSVIYCTEDAVREDELPEALHNLKKALPKLSTGAKAPMRFVRVRNPHVLGQCLSMKGITNIDGFVLPKLHHGNVKQYLSFFNQGDPFKIMPTLETVEAFDPRAMGKLRRILRDDPRAQGRVLCLRIGGNDLLNLLRVRREPNHTIYDTPMSAVISRLACEFIPYGFGLTAPVFEAMSHPHVLKEEVALDLLHGLMGKTAIHPDQIRTIEEGFSVNPEDLKAAQAILAKDAPAVFKMHDCMCEPTTHGRWARDILQRAEVYGVRSEGEHV
jgi:citrate lyase beta subunit